MIELNTMKEIHQLENSLQVDGVCYINNNNNRSSSSSFENHQKPSIF
jgi:hypothetical protein